uniref:E3 ubiquitin-protein ligase DTX3L n=1 Tax=Euleptes europaea TaxID=460621 RepID=UPI002540845D|nr:E3 ubiquitin-protein ligase DTX3L [Euleptes europaea]
MAGASPAPLFVSVSPAGPSAAAAERLERKLLLYFQAKRSGGGECEVRAEDPRRGLYRVQFRSEDAKRRVQESQYHFINPHDQTLKVRILQDSEMMNGAAKSFPQSLTSQATNPLSFSNTRQSQNSFEKMQLSENYTDNSPASITKKIFLCVSATLNTDLFTREERDKVTTLWPTLKVEKCSSKFGIEKVAGDYGDVEELYGYFETLLAESHRWAESAHPQRKNGLEKMTVNDQKDGSKTDVEEFSDMEVPSAVFEYFSRVCKGEVEDLEQRFSIKLTGVEDGSGMTSVQFASAGGPGSIEKAQQTFVTAFQKVAADLKQENIPLADIHQVNKISDMLRANFKIILVKPEGNTLILRGPARELSAAKDLMKEMEAESLPKKPEVHFPKTGMDVDTSVFEFLEPMLGTEIRNINQMYGMLMEKKKCLSSQKTYIIFKPESKKKTPDQTSKASKAYETFFTAYWKALETYTEKAIPLKHSLDLGKKVNEFFVHLQTENPRVRLRKMEDKLIISGLPEHVLSAEKHILQFLNTGSPAPPAGTLSPIHTAKAGTSSGASPEHSSVRKGHSFPSGDPSYVKAAKAEPEEEKCSICMDKIDQKEVLPKCKHAFCKGCIQEAMKYKPVCPVCNMAYGKIEGNQPPGKMEISKMRSSLPGYEGSGTIVITYHIYNGVQKENHPNPGKTFSGVTRTAYLPDNGEGREILHLLQRAFNQKLIFTVGQSRTTGINDVVTWNDIHHKTSTYGGANGYGYPDPNYLKRVREELKAKGIE